MNWVPASAGMEKMDFRASYEIINFGLGDYYDKCGGGHMTHDRRALRIQAQIRLSWQERSKPPGRIG
jgi:hypothetical protein